jgi:hypothetical protein
LRILAGSRSEIELETSRLNASKPARRCRSSSRPHPYVSTSSSSSSSSLLFSSLLFLFSLLPSAPARSEPLASLPFLSTQLSTLEKDKARATAAQAAGLPSRPSKKASKSKAKATVEERKRGDESDEERGGGERVGPTGSRDGGGHGGEGRGAAGVGMEVDKDPNATEEEEEEAEEEDKE